MTSVALPENPCSCKSTSDTVHNISLKFWAVDFDGWGDLVT